MILSPATSYPFGATTVDVEPYIGPCIVHGWAFLETSETARAKILVTDGPTGQLLLPLTLSPGQSTRDTWPGTALFVNTSLFVHVIYGTVLGTFWATSAAEAHHTLPLDLHEIADGILDTLWGSRP